MFHRKHIMKHTYCFTVVFLKLKFNIMATGTNGIATEGEAKSKLGYSGSVNTNKCCTKARAITMGADSSKLTSYKDNQLVKYSDLYKAIKTYDVSISDETYNAEIDYDKCILRINNTDKSFNGSTSIFNLNEGQTLNYIQIYIRTNNGSEINYIFSDNYDNNTTERILSTWRLVTFNILDTLNSNYTLSILES